MGDFHDLTVYKKSFDLAMEIFEATKSFPAEEKYALTNQLRRSSRSVCRSISEAYRKRKYTKHFISKLTDADMENSETQVSLEFALACGYILKEDYRIYLNKSGEIGKMLNHMINNPQNYQTKD
jgi:four helix bundle protein